MGQRDRETDIELKNAVMLPLIILSFILFKTLFINLRYTRFKLGTVSKSSLLLLLSENLMPSSLTIIGIS